MIMSPMNRLVPLTPGAAPSCGFAIRMVSDAGTRRAVPDPGSVPRREAKRVCDGRSSHAAARPGLFVWRRRGCQRERAALRIPTDGPPLAGVNDRATKLADPLQGRGQVGNREVRKRTGIAGTA